MLVLDLHIYNKTYIQVASQISEGEYFHLKNTCEKNECELYDNQPYAE